MPRSAQSGQVIVPAQHQEGFGQEYAGARVAGAEHLPDAGARSGPQQHSSDPDALEDSYKYYILCYTITSITSCVTG